MLRCRLTGLRISNTPRIFVQARLAPPASASLHTSSPKMSEKKHVHAHLKSFIPQPPPGLKESMKKDFPDTGWEGDLPSKEGGDYEKDFMNKPPYWWKSDKFEVTYTSSCWCGNVEFEWHGEPFSAKHCHCRDCQRLHGAPFQHAALYPKTAVRLKKNKNESLDFFSNHEKHSAHYVPCKVACTNCRSPLFDEGKNMVLAYPGSFNFKDHKIPHTFHATSHIFYGQRAFDVPDGVPKWESFEFSSKLLPEMTEETNVMGSLKRPLDDDTGKAMAQNSSHETTPDIANGTEATEEGGDVDADGPPEPKRKTPSRKAKK